MIPGVLLLPEGVLLFRHDKDIMEDTYLMYNV